MELRVDGPENMEVENCQQKSVLEWAREIAYDYQRDCQRSPIKQHYPLDKLLLNVVNAARALLPNFWIDSTEDLYTCSICLGFMVEPVTLKCGHSFMKSCVPSKSWSCTQCGQHYRANYLSQLKTSVTISAVLEKWWKSDIESNEMFVKGNDLSEKGNSLDAMQMYSLALTLDPCNHLAIKNRSKAFVSMGQSVAALKDAELALKLCPSFEAYLQKGNVLLSVGRTDEAIVLYFECYILYFKSKSSKSELKKLLRNLLAKRLSQNSAQLKLHQSPGSVTLEIHGQSRPRSGSDGSLNSADVSESNSDDDSRSMPTNEGDISQDLLFLQNIFVKLIYEIQQRKGVKVNGLKEIDHTLVDKRDFECPLCMRLLWQPITTPCGHTFCRTCLDRCFDHQPKCPLCKTLLSKFLAERSQQVTSFIENAISTLVPNDYAERKKIYEEELAELANAGRNQEIPLFICTIAFPTVPCPLHVFEPRYRLMIRRCMEAGTRSFGMCAHIADETDGIAGIGTMLKIKDVQYFPDGRSLVDGLGSKRFKILSKGMKDGYHTGAVEFLADLPPTAEELAETTTLHDQVRMQAEDWFKRLRGNRKSIILEHFGSMPPVEAEYASSPDGPAWLWWLLAILPLETKTQLSILGITSLYRRLDMLHKIILHIQTSNIS